MASEVVWLDDAKNDLRAILEYIAADSPNAADSYVAGITEKGRDLGDFPRSGRRYNSEFRCARFRNHLIFYRVDDIANRVLITAVIDGRRDVSDLMGEPDAQ